MTDSRTPDAPVDPESDPIGRDDQDEEIAELTALEEEPTEAFLPRLRNTIERRMLANELLSFSWFTPVVLLREFVRMGWQLVFGADSRTGGKR